MSLVHIALLLKRIEVSPGGEEKLCGPCYANMGGREMVRRGGHVQEAGGTAVRNTGLDQEGTPVGWAGQNRASDGQLGRLRTPHPSFSQHLLWSSWGPCWRWGRMKGWGGCLSLTLCPRWQVDQMSPTSCSRRQVEQMLPASFSGRWAVQILTTLSYVSDWHQRARVRCGFETAQPRLGLEPTVF